MSSNTFLGVFDVDIKNTKFAKYTPTDWVLYFVEKYGQIDGEHHRRGFSIKLLAFFAKHLSSAKKLVGPTMNLSFVSGLVTHPKNTYSGWKI